MPLKFDSPSSSTIADSQATLVPPPSYGATTRTYDHDVEAHAGAPKGKKAAQDGPRATVRMEPAWLAWRRERMQILGPVQQDKRVLLWAWCVLCIIAIALGVGLGLAYRKPRPE